MQETTVLDIGTEGAPGGPDPDVGELVDHIESTHHRYLWDVLPRLVDLADEVMTVHAERHPELYAVRDTVMVLRSELEPHLQREETDVFPVLRQLADDGPPSSSTGGVGVDELIASLVDDHDVAAELLATLRELTDSFRPPHGGCASYWTLYDALRALDADMYVHVHLENDVLFPSAAALERRRAGLGVARRAPRWVRPAR